MVIFIIFILSVTGDISLFKKRLTYTTRLNVAEGLKSGDEVRLAGKLVGKVAEVVGGKGGGAPRQKGVDRTQCGDYSWANGGKRRWLSNRTKMR